MLITPPLAKPGEAITAKTMNEIIRHVFGRITGGRGIRVKWSNDSAIIELEKSRGTGGSGGGSAGVWLPYEGED